ncbi:hypothetical protein [Mesorhizobium sp.]|nr:hypothetical protein [Mesorhizobium sp.]
MRDGNDKDGFEDEADLLIPRLIKEAEISEEQARELVEMIGTDCAVIG